MAEQGSPPAKKTPPKKTPAKTAADNIEAPPSPSPAAVAPTESIPGEQAIDTSRHHLDLMLKQLDEAVAAFRREGEGDVVRQLESVKVRLEAQKAYLPSINRDTARAQLQQYFEQLRGHLQGARKFAEAVLRRRKKPLADDARERLLNTIEQITGDATRAVTKLTSPSVEVTK